MPNRVADLAGEILEQHYGIVVKAVGMVLAKRGPTPLRLIANVCKEKLTDVKKCLAILMHHNLVTAVVHAKGFLQYKLEVDKVFLIQRYPQYIHIANSLYGDHGEKIIRQLLVKGQSRLSDLIKEIIALIGNTTVQSQLLETFKEIVRARFVERSIDVSSTTKEEELMKPKKEADESEDSDIFKYAVPDLNLASIKTEEAEGEPSSKRRKVDSKAEDDGIFWKVNASRFHQHMRDQLIASAVKSHYGDEKLSQLTAIILRLTDRQTHPWADVTVAVSKHDIARMAVKEGVCKSHNEADDLLEVFDCDPGLPHVFMAERAAGGGTYSVNTSKSLDQLVQSCVTSIVEHRFGAKCSRVFRILIAKRALQQKHIEEIAMIPPKECKELIFTLVKEGYVKMVQIPKQLDYVPSKTFFIFKVDLEKVVRHSIALCRTGVYNSIIRREFEYNRNRALIERRNHVDAVIANLELQENSEQQIEDLSATFSTHDAEVLKRTKKACNNLEMTELQVDETLFLLELWLASKTYN